MHDYIVKSTGKEMSVTEKGIISISMLNLYLLIFLITTIFKKIIIFLSSIDITF